MKGQIVVQVNDDDTIQIQSTKPKDVRRPTLAHYGFETVEKGIEAAGKEIKAISLIGDIRLLEN